MPGTLKRIVRWPARFVAEVKHGRDLTAARARLRNLDRPSKPRAAAIIPPALPGSVGDAAMMSAAADMLRSRGFGRVDLFYGGNWPLDAEIDHRLETDSYFFGSSAARHIELVDAIADYEAVLFVGADVIDGAYASGSVRRRLSLVREAALSGRAGVILGASYNEAPVHGLEAFIRDMPENVAICAREPASRGRMEIAFRRPILQTADLAFLLAPRPQHRDAVAAIEWVASRRAVGDPVLGFNLNYLQVDREPTLLDAQIEAARMLVENGRSLLLISQDSRTKRSDAVLAKTLIERLPHHLQSRTYLLETLSPGAIKAALGCVDVLVTGRLHALILALGAGAPGVAIGYQDKFEGLYDLLGMPRDQFLTYPGAVIADPSSLVRLAEDALSEMDDLRAKIALQLPQLVAMSRANFDPLRQIGSSMQ